MPSPLPSTLKFKPEGHREEPEAKVEHRVKIKLKDTEFEDSPSFRKEFKVRNDKLLLKGEKLQREKSEDVVICGCCAKGKIDMKAHFEKEFFYKDEKAHCKVQGDLK